jgi:hypothetical protein
MIRCQIKRDKNDEIEKVLAENGAESIAYDSLLDTVKNSSEEQIKSLQKRFKPWVGKKIKNITDPKELALALYKQMHSPNFNSRFNKELDANGEPVISTNLEHLSLAGDSAIKQLPPTREQKTGVDEFLKRIGIDIKEVREIPVNGKALGVAGLYDPAKRLIQYVLGKKDTVLPEEASHLAVDIIESTNKTLYNEMFNKVSQYARWKELLNDKGYRENPLYKKDGKIDIPKLKKEAIGKVLADYITKGESAKDEPNLVAQAQRWWNRVAEFVNHLFKKTGISEDVFGDVATSIKENKLQGNVQDIRHKDSLANVDEGLRRRDEIYNTIKERSQSISKVTQEDGSSYYMAGDKKVKNRVTDLAKAIYKKVFGEEKPTEYNEMLRESGTAGHADIENIIDRYVGDDGLLRDKPLEQEEISQINPEDPSFYNTLEKNISDRLRSYPSGTKFIKEQMVYDPRLDRAGTIDFLAITPNGKVDILDWKFMNLNPEKKTDISKTKQRAYQAQIGDYKRILKDVYGLRESEFSRTQAVPIIASYAKIGDNYQITSLNIGDVNVQNIDKNYLLPVPLKEQRTNDPKINALLGQLQGLEEKISATRVPAGKEIDKKARLSQINSAIRNLQVKGSLKETASLAEGIIKDNKELIDDYRDNYLGQGKIISGKDAEALAKRLRDAHTALDIYSKLGTTFVDQFDKNNPEDKAFLERLKNITLNSQYFKDQIEELMKDFAQEYIASSYNIDDLLRPEKVIGTRKRLFSAFSELPIRSLNVLYKMVRPIQDKIAIESSNEANRLEHFQKQVRDLAAKKGVSEQSMLDSIMQKQDGKAIPKLIEKVSREFNEAFNKEKTDKNRKWFEDNINMGDYKNWYEDRKKEQFDHIDKYNYTGDESENEKIRKAEKERFESEFNPEMDSALGNWAMKQFVKEDWDSAEYKNLLKSENKPLLDLYNHLQEWNNRAYKAGLINAYEYRTFAPQAYKGFIESLSSRTTHNPFESFINDISGRSEVPKRDPNTGEIIRDIPVKYMKSLAKESVDSEGNKKLDYSKVSTDLLRTYALFAGEVMRYEEYSAIQDRVEMLSYLEGTKKALETNSLGDLIREDPKDPNSPFKTKEDNSANTKVFNNFKNYYLYGDRFSDGEEFDQKLGKWSDESAKKINNFLHLKILPEDLGDRDISATKTIEKLNRFFRMKVLGLSLAPSISNLFGGATHSAIVSGGRYTLSDIAKGYLMMASNTFATKEGRKYAAMIDYFLPLLENEMYNDADKLSTNRVSRMLTDKNLYYLMRNSDKWVQVPHAIAHFDNTMIEDGKFININDYAKKKYADRYDLSLTQEQRNEATKQMNKEIEDLKKTRSLSHVSELDEHGKLSFPGIDRASEATYKLREMIQNGAKDILGNSTMEDINGIRMTVLGNSFMMFKNWVPRLVKTRFGDLDYSVGRDSYEWGRVRMLGQALHWNMFKTLGDLHGVLTGNNKGISFMNDIYNRKAEQFKRRTGEDFKMDKAAFMDMYKQGIRSLGKEAAMLATMLGMYYSVRFHSTKDDDYTEKGYWKWATRTMDRLSDELNYFYSPLSLQSIAGGSIFPAIQTIVDMQKILVNMTEEGVGLAMGEGPKEGLRGKAHVAGSILKALPITKEMLVYTAIFNKDLAQQFGYQISTNAGPH